LTETLNALLLVSITTCGHTHLALTAERGGVRYFNSGTWIEHPPFPFVAVLRSSVQLLTWPLSPDGVPREIVADVAEPATKPA